VPAAHQPHGFRPARAGCLARVVALPAEYVKGGASCQCGTHLQIVNVMIVREEPDGSLLLINQTEHAKISGLASTVDKVKGLGIGADDYLTKPFHKDELVARIHAIVRRSKGHSQSVIQTGELVVNLETKTVEVDGARVYLTGKEYQMLELLSLRKGTPLTKEMFLNHLYGGMDEPEPKIIDVFICKLRRKLANACNGKNFVETVWGRGHVLRDPEGEARISI